MANAIYMVSYYQSAASGPWELGYILPDGTRGKLSWATLNDATAAAAQPQGPPVLHLANTNAFNEFDALFS